MSCYRAGMSVDRSAPRANHGDDVQCACVENDMGAGSIGERGSALRDNAGVRCLPRLDGMKRAICRFAPPVRDAVGAVGRLLDLPYKQARHQGVKEPGRHVDDVTWMHDHACQERLDRLVAAQRSGETPWVYGRIAADRKSTRLNSSHTDISRMPSSA